MIALRHVEEALGLTPARKKFPLNMEVMNVMDLLLLMKAVTFKNVQVIQLNNLSHFELQMMFIMSILLINFVSF